MKSDEIEYDAAKLRQARLDRRMTQAELARRTGLSIGAISQVEAGKGPWLKAIREMEQVLGITTSVNMSSFKN